MPERPYTFFQHDADVGIVAHGDSVEKAFEAAARGMFAMMAELSSVRPEIAREVAFNEEDREHALVTWLNMLLAEAREEGLVFSRFRLLQRDGKWIGKAWGQPWREDLDQGVDVKGATTALLSVTKADSGWQARCVVDV